MDLYEMSHRHILHYTQRLVLHAICYVGVKYTYIEKEYIGLN